MFEKPVNDLDRGDFWRFFFCVMRWCAFVCFRDCDEMFPCKYHQNGGFSMAMLVSGRVLCIFPCIASHKLVASRLTFGSSNPLDSGDLFAMNRVKIYRST